VVEVANDRFPAPPNWANINRTFFYMYTKINVTTWVGILIPIELINKIYNDFKEGNDYTKFSFLSW